jgi:hypothetical protein
MKADIAIEFTKDHEWDLNGNKKFNKKGDKMIGSPEFLEQFIKAKAAKDITGKMESVKEQIEKIINDNIE